MQFAFGRERRARTQNGTGSHKIAVWYLVENVCSQLYSAVRWPTEIYWLCAVFILWIVYLYEITRGEAADSGARKKTNEKWNGKKSGEGRIESGKRDCLLHPCWTMATNRPLGQIKRIFYSQAREYECASSVCCVSVQHIQHWTREYISEWVLRARDQLNTNPIPIDFDCVHLAWAFLSDNRFMTCTFFVVVVIIIIFVRAYFLALQLQYFIVRFSSFSVIRRCGRNHIIGNNTNRKYTAK